MTRLPKHSKSIHLMASFLTFMLVVVFYVLLLCAVPFKSKLNDSITIRALSFQRSGVHFRKRSL